MRRARTTRGARGDVPRDRAPANGPRDGAPARGYTLLEILIAVSILVILGGGLTTLLTQGLSIWRRAETRGQVYEQARVLFDQLAEDLRSAVTTSSGARDAGWVRFIADEDAAGRQRLRFVRTISGETADPILREGGQYLSVRTPAIYDGSHDSWEAREGLLGAPGGLMEVFYGLDPRRGETLLWRGVRTPLGSSGSLFDDALIEARGARPGLARRSGSITGSDDGDDGDDDGDDDDAGAGDREPTDADPDDGVAFARVARPLTDGVLFLGFGFWGPTTNTWSPRVLPLVSRRSGEESGPLLHWDSTRAILDYRGEPRELTFVARDGSLTDSSDDIFPARVEVTLVLRDDDRESLVLAENATRTATRLVLSRPVTLPDDERDRFVRVGEEWIAAASIGGRTIEVARDGRGTRGTLAVSHEAGVAVDVGVTFRRVIELPGSRRGHEVAVPRESTSGRHGR